MTRKEIERMVETAQIEEYRWHCFCDREGTTLARVVEDVELFDEWDALNDMDARTLRSLIYDRVHRICETPPNDEAVGLLHRWVAIHPDDELVPDVAGWNALADETRAYLRRHAATDALGE